jgi:hypothetical protein
MAVGGAVFACQNRAPWVPFDLSARPGVYFLLCMFNGFAFARPLFGRIKVILTGVGFTLIAHCVRWGCRAAG